MALLYTDHDVPLAYCLVPHEPRPIVAVVLHDTEGSGVSECRPDGSWHWQIDRLGGLHRHVEEDLIAFHVRDTDRWRPAWVLESPYEVSDVNYCTIGVELVSSASVRLAGQPYTDAQYDTLSLLVQEIEGRYGVLPWVGHGQMQADRTDPVSFDWGRLFDGTPQRWFYSRIAAPPVPAPTGDFNYRLKMAYEGLLREPLYHKRQQGKRVRYVAISEDELQSMIAAAQQG